mmetsp:Transcript_87066/g.246993  ORF Transcript_87066/g.246993 Transcript_87066/m.246993 type:complete len:461 (-) Transcript_87066:1575-2957(-)
MNDNFQSGGGLGGGGGAKSRGSQNTPITSTHGTFRTTGRDLPLGIGPGSHQGDAGLSSGPSSILSSIPSSQWRGEAGSTGPSIHSLVLGGNDEEKREIENESEMEIQNSERTEPSEHVSNSVVDDGNSVVDGGTENGSGSWKNLTLDNGTGTSGSLGSVSWNKTFDRSLSNGTQDDSASTTSSYSRKSPPEFARSPTRKRRGSMGSIDISASAELKAMHDVKPVVVPEGMPRMRSAIRPRARSGASDVGADLKAVPEKHVGDMHPTLKDQLRTSSISGDSAWAAIARQRAAKAGAASSIVPLVKAKDTDPGLDALIAMSSVEPGGGAYPTEQAEPALSPVCVVCSENCEDCRVAPDGQGHVASGGAAGVERSDSQKDPFQKAERHPDCGHWFHVHCSEGLRRHGVTQACLICRSSLMPGPERLFEEATLRYWRIVRRIEMGELGWKDLPQSLEDEVTADS